MKLFINKKDKIIFISFASVFMVAAIVFGVLFFTLKPQTVAKKTTPTPAASTKPSTISSPTSTTSSISGQNVGMSDEIKFNFESADAFDIIILDKDNKVVASVIDSVEKGFDESNYIYDFFAGEGTDHRANIYVPNGGVKVNISIGNKEGSKINFIAEASTLGDGGNKSATATFGALKTGKDGQVFSFDLVSPTSKPKIGGIVKGVKPLKFVQYADWSITESIRMNIDETKKVEISGVGASFDRKSISWDTNDKSVASVSDIGVITANDYGTTLLHAIDNGGKMINCLITVTLNPTAMKIPDMKLEVKRRDTLEPVFTPAKATEINTNYTGYDKNIIEIDKNQSVIAKSAGTTIVTATTDNGITTTFKVTITPGS